MGIISGSVITKYKITKDTDKWRKLSDKHLDLFLMMNQWVKIKQKDENISSYFEQNGYKKIAVYGMGHAGETLLSELEGTGIQVAYGIDKSAKKVYANIDVVTMESTLDLVDAIVVTAITYFDEVKEELNVKVNCPIISLEDILYKL